jgi:hypothetical protein
MKKKNGCIGRHFKLREKVLDADLSDRDIDFDDIYPENFRPS